MKALLIKADGTAPENVELENFAAIKKSIGGGHVCIAEINPSTEEDFDMLCCDEDGLAKELPFNLKATNKANWPYPIVGDVVICRSADFFAITND